MPYAKSTHYKFTILLISYLGKMNTWFRSKEKETELAGAGKNFQSICYECDVYYYFYH